MGTIIFLAVFVLIAVVTATMAYRGVHKYPKSNVKIDEDAKRNHGNGIKL